MVGFEFPLFVPLPPGVGLFRETHRLSTRWIRHCVLKFSNEGWGGWGVALYLMDDERKKIEG